MTTVIMPEGKEDAQFIYKDDKQPSNNDVFYVDQVEALRKLAYCKQRGYFVKVISPRIVEVDTLVH